MKVTHTDSETWIRPGGERRRWVRNSFADVKNEKEFFRAVRHMARRLGWDPDFLVENVREKGNAYRFPELEWDFFWWVDGSLDAYLEGSC